MNAGLKANEVFPAQPDELSQNDDIPVNNQLHKISLVYRDL
jgi:hypothetical protein